MPLPFGALNAKDRRRLYGIVAAVALHGRSVPRAPTVGHPDPPKLDVAIEMAVSDGWMPTQVLADAPRLQRSAVAAAVVCLEHNIRVSRSRWLCGLSPYCTRRASLFERMARTGIDRLEALQRELEADTRWGVPPGGLAPFSGAASAARHSAARGALRRQLLHLRAAPAAAERLWCS